MGANIYLYHGFIHTKALVVDDEVMTMGSCNMDIRSFALNFEVNSVIYGNEFIKPFLINFDNDLLESDKIDKLYFKKLSLVKKLGMSVSRLFSAIL